MTDRVLAAFDCVLARLAPLPTPWRALWTNQRTAIHLGLLGAAVLFVHYRTFDWLVQTWWRDPGNSHGFLIPLIAFYLVWIKRGYLAQLPPRSHLATGGLLLLFSMILLLAGRAGGFVLAEGISLLILLPAIVLSVWGPDHLRALLVPLGYIQFMIPWMGEFLAHISLPSQLLSARLGSLLLRAMGFSVFREATYLHVSNVTLEVAPACSGISYLTSMIALGIPLVYLTQRTWWRAAAVLVFSAAITLPVNGVRVALVAAVGSYFGESTLHGPFHIFQGWLVGQLGILFLILINWSVTKLPSTSPVKLHERWRDSAAVLPPTRNPSRTIGWSGLLILSLLVFGYYLHFFATPHPVPPRRSLAELPQVVNGWHGQASGWIEGGHLFPGAAVESIRTYHNVAGKEILLYIGYFASQREGELLTGKSSNPIRRDARELPLPRPVAGLQRVNHSVPTIDGKRYEALFWYHLPSGKTTGRYETKLRQFLDAIIRRHNNGAVVLLATPVSENHDGKGTVDDLLEFASVLAPVLEEYLP